MDSVMMPIEMACQLGMRKRDLRRKSPSTCMACRARRLPCNGEKPCKTCTSTRQICQHYRSSPNSSSSSRSASLPSRAQAVSISAAPSSLTNLFTTDQEHRSFTFFCEYTIPHISSAFSDEFWNRLVLQAIHHEPAVRHAAIAFGALHERFTQHDTSPSQHSEREANDNFALSQYVKALRSVLEPIRAERKQAADITLMTCILFICFETVRGHHSSALNHVDSGIKIISELSSHGASASLAHLTIPANPYTPLSTLRRIFIRLEAQAGSLTFGHKRTLISTSYELGSESNEDKIPPSFTTVEEARNSLEYIRTVGSQTPRTFYTISEARSGSSSASLDTIHTTKVPHSIPPTASRVQAAKAEVAVELIRSSASLRLKQWQRAFSSFLATLCPNRLHDPAMRESILLCKIHKSVMELSFKIDYWRAVHDEMVWDELLPEWSDIVSFSEDFVACAEEAGKGKRQKVFNLDIALIVPLYFVAGKCRDAQLRRRAIELLRRSERQEGVSNSLMAARVAERLVEIEEEGLLDRDKVGHGPADCVTRERRISGVEIKLGLEGERRAWLRFSKTGGREVVVEEWVEW